MSQPYDLLMEELVRSLLYSTQSTVNDFKVRWQIFHCSPVVINIIHEISYIRTCGL